MTVYHKFKAKQTISDNIKFASKLEASYYEQLKLRQKAGEVLFFLRQVPMAIPGGKYLIDFVVFKENNEVDFIEIKGFDTPMSKFKIKSAEEIYPVKIKILRDGDF